MQGYDISRLQIPMGDTDSMIKGPPPEEPMMYRRDMMPVGSEYSLTSFEWSTSWDTGNPISWDLLQKSNCLVTVK